MPEQNDIHNEHNNVELRSEAIQEILGRPPRWIIRSGITVIFIVVLLLLIGSYFFRYPDIVSSAITITTKNPPSWVLARSTGKLQNLFVEDKQVVRTGDILAMIDNPANPNDVFAMKEELDLLEDFFHTLDIKDLVALKNEKFKLGELQESYASIVKQLKDYERFLSLDYYTKKRQSLVRELEGQQKYYQLLLRQHKLQEQDTDLAEKQFMRETELFNKQAISTVDYENAEKQILSSRRSIEQSNIGISNALISIEQQQQRITELDLDYEDKLKEMQINLQNSYEQLKARISIWEQQYVLKAQINGTISFNSIWSVNHQVNSGEKIFAIIPEDQGELVGKMNLPASSGYGKVKAGQNVNIKLDGYPYMEYGMLKGEVTSISLVPTARSTQMSEEKIYTVEIALPNGLVSFYHHTFDFTGELTGIAEISTDELSVLERFFQPLKYLFKKNVETPTSSTPEQEPVALLRKLGE